MPQTLRSRLRQWIYSLGFVAVIIGLNFSDSDLRHDFGFLLSWMVPMIIGILAVALPTFEYANPIQKRWSGHHAELPLLALLPGLGAAPVACMPGPALGTRAARVAGALRVQRHES